MSSKAKDVIKEIENMIEYAKFPDVVERSGIRAIALIKKSEEPCKTCGTARHPECSVCGNTGKPCESCGEYHRPPVMCPPHEVRMKQAKDICPVCGRTPEYKPEEPKLYLVYDEAEVKKIVNQVLNSHREREVESITKQVYYYLGTILNKPEEAVIYTKNIRKTLSSIDVNNSDLPTRTLHKLLTDACLAYDRLTEERDLAIAHDRQPYPTAQAYEKVCAALRKKEAECDRQAAELKKLTQYRDYVESRIADASYSKYPWLPLCFKDWDKCVNDLAKDLEEFVKEKQDAE